MHADFRVMEKDHTVILNWSQRTVPILRQIAKTREVYGGRKRDGMRGRRTQDVGGTTSTLVHERYFYFGASKRDLGTLRPACLPAEHSEYTSCLHSALV